MANLLVLVSLLLVARVASAAGAAERKEREARTACLSGDYAKGVTILSELFVDSKNPTYIYNQGRCFEQNRRYEDAIARFQEYLRVRKNLKSAERAEAQRHIDGCKQLLAEEAVPPSAPASTAPEPVSIVAAPTPPVPQPPVAPLIEQQRVVPVPATRSAGSRLPIAGILTASVGGAALLGGVLLNFKVNSMANELQKPNGYTNGRESSRKTYETLGWVGYGVGAVCVTTGAILYALGMRSSGASDRATLAPSISVGQVGAALQGSF